MGYDENQFESLKLQFSQIAKRILNYEYDPTRKISKPEKVDEYLVALSEAYNGIVSYLEYCYPEFDEKSKQTACQYIKDYYAKVERCARAVKLKVRTPAKFFDKISKTSFCETSDSNLNTNPSETSPFKKTTTNDTNEDSDDLAAGGEKSVEKTLSEKTQSHTNSKESESNIHREKLLVNS